MELKEKYLLAELINIELLQNFQEKLNEIYSFPSAVIDNEGNILTAVAWQDICTKFHRPTPLCEKDCIKSDQYILEHLHEANPSVSYQCPRGLVDNAIPIIIDGQHLANFFTGQFFLEKPDIDFFRKQALEFGFDEQEYLEAVAKVPIWSKKKVAQYLDFISEFIQMIAGFGLQSLKEKENNENIRISEERFRLLIENSSDMVTLHDSDGRYHYYSGPQKYGVKPTDVIGKTPYDFFEKDVAHNIIKQIKKTAQTGEHRKIEIYTNWQGEMTWFEENIYPLKKENNIIFVVKICSDITERKKQEMELLRAKEKAVEKEILNNKLLANISDVIVIIDHERNTQYKSPNVEKLFGWKPEELIGNNAFENVHPDDIEQARIFIDSIYSESNKSGTTEVQYRHKNGNYVWIKFTATNLLHDPVINGILGNYHEISDKKKSEIELLKAREKTNKYTEMIISSQSVANICSYSTNLIEDDIDKSVWECSPEFYKIFGIDETYPHTIAGWAEFIHPDFREELVAYHESVIKNRSSFNKEYKIIRINDGIERWVRGTGELVYDKHRNPVRMYGAIQDITEIKKTEDDLIKAKEKAEENEEKLIEAQKLSHVGSWEYYIETGMVFWSKELYSIFERSNNLPAPKYNEQQSFYTAESFIKLDKVVQDCIQKEIPYEIELDIITSSGGVKQIISKGHVKKDEKGKIIGSYGTAQDITMQKKLERELIISKEKAEEANRLKTEFLNNMSHEIRTPMNGIIGFSEMLDKPDISDEKRKYFSKLVQNSSQQLLRIIDDILEISVLETKQERLNETEFCLNDLLMELFSIFNLKSKERNIPLYLEKAYCDDKSHILSDRTKIIKILSNLLENSLKFTNKGFIEFGYYIEKSNLIFYVKDTGIGIAPKKHEIIFERFAQEDKEISSNHGGLGLGLSICKENAQLLSGNLTLESEKGKGSTFYLTIPYNPVKIANDNAKKTSNDNNIDDKYTILVAEDEEVNYLYIEVLFEEEFDGNYNLIHAKNGKEAVETCTSNHNIDLVLMDIKMPVMGGLEAAEKIKSKLPSLPIIAQTAYSTESDKKLALKHGCDEFISKPINKEKLFGLINKYLKIK